MNYTLDSVEHAVNCLANKFNVQVKDIARQSLVCTLEELTETQKDVHYFGIISSGENIEKIEIEFLNLKFIKIQSNSQIVCLFSSLDLTKTDAFFAKGQFRGFRLSVPDNTFLNPIY